MINQDLIATQWFDYMTRSVKDKAIVVTGGTTGIGRATALLLACEGARVAIVGRHEKEMNEALDQFKQISTENQVTGLLGDTGNPDDVKRIFQEAEAQLGGLDVLVNNAALPYNSIMDGTDEEWRYAVEVNLMGYMACAREAVPRMKERAEGHIVNIGSMSAEVSENGSSVYVATKAGVRGFTKSLRKELNKHGIHVTLIEPGAVGSDMSGGTRQEQMEQQEEMTMLKAEDIAACVLYVLTQPKRCDVISVQIRPHQQII